MALHHKAFRYRVYPTPEQESRLRWWEGSLRFLWNLAHGQRLYYFKRHSHDRHYFSDFDQINQLTELRAEVPWLADVPRDVCAQLLIELDLAWQRWFEKLAEEPKFKKRGRCRVAMCEPHPKGWHIEGNNIFFPKMGAMRAIIHRPIEGTPKKCCITRDVDQWFVSIVCEIEMPDVERKPGIVGIDRGVVNVVADSNGELIKSPDFLKKGAKKIRHAQRLAARKEKGSNNWKKAQLRVARLQRKVRRQRDHFLHPIALHYAESQGTVVVEKLQVRNMTRSARGTKEKPGKNVRAKAGLNRSILDAGWGKLHGMLKYKMGWRNGLLLEVLAAYSSQTCSVCGVVDARSRRSQSEFVCVACGHTEHADINAAKVVLGRGNYGLVCNPAAVAKRPTGQKLRVARRGTRSKRPVAPKAPAFRPG